MQREKVFFSRIVGLGTLITGIRSRENDSRQDASERGCNECTMKDDLKKGKGLGNFALLVPFGPHARRTLTVDLSDLAMCGIAFGGPDAGIDLGQIDWNRLERRWLAGLWKFPRS